MLAPILQSKQTSSFLNEIKFSSVFASVFVILEALGWHNNLSFMVASYRKLPMTTWASQTLTVSSRGSNFYSLDARVQA